MNRPLKIALLAVMAFYLASTFYYERWGTNIIGGGDSWGYNAYLPALFIHHDLPTLEKTIAARRLYHVGFGDSGRNPLGIDEAQHIGEGRQIIKYTMGVAILQAPFFAMGHAGAVLTGAPTDGYSRPYVSAVHFANLFYLFIGLWLLVKVWRAHFAEHTTLLLLLGITLGTNLYYFSVFSGPMAHSYLFALYALLIYGTWRFYQQPALRYAILIGLSAGFITLIRPVEIIALAIPLTYGLSDRTSLRARGELIARHWPLFVAAAIAFVACGLPQLLYWKQVSGQWLYYSYGEEGFNFRDPHIWKGMTSFRNGWLIYTPLMALALAGIAGLWRKAWWWPVAIFLPLHLYITYSWWCWYYINGFGSRPMVETYALLAFPLGYSLQFLQKRLATRLAMYVLLLGFMVLNVFQTYQHWIGIMWSEDVTPAYYWSVFGKTTLTYDDIVAFDSNEPQPDTARLTRVRVLSLNTLPDSTDVWFQRDTVYSPPFAYRVTRERQYAPDYYATLADMGAQPGDYLRFSVWCFKAAKEASWLTMPLLVTTFDREGRLYRYRQVRVDSKIHNTQPSLWGGEGGIWGEVSFFVRVPSRAKPNDLFKAYVHNGQGQVLYVDDIQVEHWRRR